MRFDREPTGPGKVIKRTAKGPKPQQKARRGKYGPPAKPKAKRAR